MGHPTTPAKGPPPRILTKVEESSLKQAFATELKTATGKKRFKFLRDLLLIELALDAGFRVGECQKFKVSDVWQNMTVKSEIRLIADFNKHNPERRVKIAPDLKRVLELYIPLRLSPMPPEGEQALLLTPKPGQKSKNPGLKRADVCWILKFWTDKAGLPHLKFHWLRHTFASRFYWQGGLDLVETQTMIGHRSLDATRIYLHPEQDSMDRHLEEARPAQLGDLI